MIDLTVLIFDDTVSYENVVKLLSIDSITYGGYTIYGLRSKVLSQHTWKPSQGQNFSKVENLAKLSV